MQEAGFFAQKRNSPTSLGLVILLHGALITAVVLIKSPTFIHAMDRTVLTFVPNEEVPPPDQQPPPRQQPQHQQERLDQPPPLTPTPPTGPAVDTRPPPNQFAGTIIGSGTIDIPQLPPPPPLPIPVRHAAQIDSRSQLQPPYPSAELRAQRDGRVQVRVTIGPDGRVIDVARLSATSDAFWLVTREQALHHWRFRPATVDGQPVQDVRVMSLVFRIEDQG